MKTTLKLFATAFLLSACSSVLAAGGAKHLPGIFIGATHAQDESEFTYGIEYEYKLSDQLGLGALYEKTPDAHYEDGVSIKLAQLFYHPNQNIRLGIGIGKEKIHGSHSYTKDLYRTGVSYEIFVGDFVVAPTVAVDFIDGEKAYVLGVAFIRPF